MQLARLIMAIELLLCWAGKWMSCGSGIGEVNVLLNELLQGFPVVVEGHDVVLTDRRSVGPEDNLLKVVDENVELVMRDEALCGEGDLQAELRRCGHGQLHAHQRAEQIISIKARELGSGGDAAAASFRAARGLDANPDVVHLPGDLAESGKEVVQLPYEQLHVIGETMRHGAHQHPLEASQGFRVRVGVPSHLESTIVVHKKCLHAGGEENAGAAGGGWRAELR